MKLSTCIKEFNNLECVVCIKMRMHLLVVLIVRGFFLLLLQMPVVSINIGEYHKRGSFAILIEKYPDKNYLKA